MADFQRKSGISGTYTTKRHCRRDGASRPAFRTAELRALTDFDAEAWMSLVEEQRLTIARAAGVDPSKVRIQIGH